MGDIIPCQMLTMRYHSSSDGYAIVNGKNEILGITTISRGQLEIEAPGNTLTEKLRWLINSGQYVPTYRADEHHA